MPLAHVGAGLPLVAAVVLAAAGPACPFQDGKPAAPVCQVYTSNGMNGSVIGSSDTTYRQTEGFTLETQHFPDSPNKPDFPTTELKPGQQFRSTTIFRFATDASLPPLPR